MIQALEAAGFDTNNEEHWLISCGDEIDRGPEPWKVMKYLYNLPRKVLIRGNHMELFEDLCYRGFAYSHDKSNGTYDSVRKIGRGFDFYEKCDHALKRTKDYRDSLVNYFETKNYIFVHSWVPVLNKDGLPAYYTRNRQFEWREDWRDASPKEWRDSMWGNPFDMAAQGFNKTEKCIVFGHWSTEYQWAKDEGRREFDSKAKFDPYYGDGFIAIDACTAYSGKVNVVVIEDEFLEDGNEQ
jgi:hypothetical protein